MGCSPGRTTPLATITTVLVMLLAVVASGYVSRALPSAIPLPLVQIALGAAIAPFASVSVVLEPDIFFLLFLPPLLFLDGWRIPKEGLFRDKGVILELALGLVVTTVVGLGFFIHWMIPTMPLAVAFALAAVVSPTDPIAVSAITARTPMPKRLTHILEGESLLNDASGLVCMRFAVAAALTGHFSIAEAGVTFLWVALGGVAIGVGVTFAANRAKDWLSRRLGEDPGVHILISLLIPFGAYLLAEHFHCSGILAAVSAGIAQSYALTLGVTQAATRMRGAAVWDTIQFSANGVIFVLLGEQLPGIVSGAARVVQEAGRPHAIWLVVYAVAIVAVLAALRFAWAWTSLQFTMFRAARRGETFEAPSWRLIAAVSAAGVRGAITLAGVLTLPLTMTDGSPFPARDLAIFLAACVIILSLVIASVALPRLMKGLELPPEPSHEAQEDAARVRAAEAAIKAIEQAQHDMADGRDDADLIAETGSRLMELYRRRIDARSEANETAAEIRMTEQFERTLRLVGLRAERDEIFRGQRSRTIEGETSRRLTREIDLMETRLNA